MGDAHAIGITVVFEKRFGFAGIGVVNKKPPGRPSFDRIQRPVVGVIARG